MMIQIVSRGYRKGQTAMKHIPNILSGLRIVMIPFLIWQMMKDNTLAAGLILVASGITDTLDGNLARHFGWVTDLGKILDPIADKLTQTAVSLCLLLRYPRLWFLFAILIIKDGIMLVLGGYLTKNGVNIDGARMFGKVATVIFYVFMILIVLFPAMPDRAITAMLATEVVCAVAAGLSYIPDFRRYLAQKNETCSD